MTKINSFNSLTMFIAVIILLGFGLALDAAAQEATSNDGPQQRSVDEAVIRIINKNTEAVGGVEALASVKTIHRNGSVSGKSSYGPFQGTAEEVSDLASVRTFIAIELGDYKRQAVWNGDSGWAKDTQIGMTGLLADEAMITKFGYSPSPLFAAHGLPDIVLKQEDDQELAGNKCSVISIKGTALQFYVNQESHLLERLSAGEELVVTFENYKSQGGVMFPGKRTMEVKSQSLTMVMEYSSTKLNGTVDDSIFEKSSDTKKEESAGEYSAEQIISFMDKDGDGKISQDEASSKLKPNFGYVDTNSDGLIDLAEAKAMVEYTKSEKAASLDVAFTKTPETDATSSAVAAKQLIASMDKDSDEKISMVEADEDLKLFFANYDADGDGLIDQQEAKKLASYANDAAAPTAKTPRVTAKQLLEEMDTDGDGEITMEEAPAQLKENFSYIDTNSDGVVDEKEAQAIADYMNLPR